jgi:hypothetical protein
LQERIVFLDTFFGYTNAGGTDDVVNETISARDTANTQVTLRMNTSATMCTIGI